MLLYRTNSIQKRSEVDYNIMVSESCWICSKLRYYSSYLSAYVDLSRSVECIFGIYQVNGHYSIASVSTGKIMQSMFCRPMYYYARFHIICVPAWRNSVIVCTGLFSRLYNGLDIATRPKRTYTRQSATYWPHQPV